MLTQALSAIDTGCERPDCVVELIVIDPSLHLQHTVTSKAISAELTFLIVQMHLSRFSVTYHDAVVLAR